jgi:hypothetical protein
MGLTRAGNQRFMATPFQIRANLYATFIIMAVIPRRHSTEKLLDALHANVGVATFGFLITAMIQTIQNRLDLYHAIFAAVILSYLGLFVYASGSHRPLARSHRLPLLTHGSVIQPELIKWVIKNNKEIRLMALISRIRLGAHPRATRREGIIQITTAIALILTAMIKIMAFATYLVWSIYIWVNAETFGSTPECNAQVKVIGFLFHSVSPTNLPMRIFWIISLCLSAAFIIIVTIFIMREGHRRNISEGGLVEAVFNSSLYSETVDKMFRSKPWVIPSIFLTCVHFPLAFGYRK